MSRDPLRLQVVAALQRNPNGLSTRELERELGISSAYTLSSVLSKMFLYGAPIEKIGPSHGQGVKWRWRS